MASLFAEFFRDLDIVPSDIIAGLVLLRQTQRSKRSSILDQVRPSQGRKKGGGRTVVCIVCSLNILPFSSQANNDIIAFLSGMPVTRNTRYLDLKNAVRRTESRLTLLREVCSDTLLLFRPSLLFQGEMNNYKDVCYYMLFALAAYGWPMYLMRKPACGLCRLVSSCP